MEWIDPKLIEWDPELNTSEPEPGHEGVVDVILLPDGTYEGAYGKKLCEEAITLGRPLVLCVVQRGTREDVVEASMAVSLNQNLPKPDPLKGVEWVKNANLNLGWNKSRIIRVSGRSAKWVNDRLLISKASPAVKQCLEEGTIRLGNAALLAGIKDLEQQEQMLLKLLTYGWTVRKLEEAIHLSSHED